jgi:hypothetical protein
MTHTDPSSGCCGHYKGELDPQLAGEKQVAELLNLRARRVILQRR